MNLTKEVKNLLVGFIMGLSSTDKEILYGSLMQAPEYAKEVSATKQTKSDFLRAIQQGRLSEQQLKWFYRHLDLMDEFHRNGGAMAALGQTKIALNEGQLIKTNDHEPGYSTSITFQNRIIENSIGQKAIPTLTILRDNARWGTYKIEDYCTEVMIKDGGYGKNKIAEFYCVDYKVNGTDLTEKVYDKISDGYNLQNFINIQAFNAIRSTATRNGIDHPYKIISFYKIKKLSKGFVVKFMIEEL